MKVSKIILCKTIQDIHEVVELANKVPAKVYARHQEYTVDCKSLLGVMSLNLSMPISIDCEDMPEEIIEQLQKFSVYNK